MIITTYPERSRNALLSVPLKYFFKSKRDIPRAPAITTARWFTCYLANERNLVMISDILLIVFLFAEFLYLFARSDENRSNPILK